MTDNDIMNVGMRSLVESLGVVDAQRFIATLIRNASDYTEWQRDLFESMSLEELGKKVMVSRQNKRSLTQV